MHQSVLVCVLVVAALTAPFLPRCQAQLDILAPLLGDQVKGLFRQGEAVLLDHYCNYSVKPKFRKWELYFDGSFWCPGWTNIKGEALTRSQSSVVNKATEDFIKKAQAKGLISDEEAKSWFGAN
ncbi:anti-lipopolysaccharide factor [Procambarus clarkii]|uniref:anti-lipopolysaccharide factor n=1 Tax=Procambarus clarkii TaxID=6728 RepID=UPI003744552C